MIDSNIKQQVLARAIKDTAFRQDLVNNPRATLAREFNIQMADSVTMRVVELTTTTLTLVLPPLETAMQELRNNLEQDLSRPLGCDREVCSLVLNLGNPRQRAQCVQRGKRVFQLQLDDTGPIALLEVRGRIQRNKPAVVENGELVTEGLRLFQVVGRDEHRPTLLA